MRNIYSLALCSFAWLGPEGDNSDEAIDMLETMNLALETPDFLQIDGNLFVRVLDQLPGTDR
jgi:hypothetical protein